MEDNSDAWVDQEIMDVISFFVGKGGLDHVFTEESPSSNWGVLSPKDNKKICRKYMCDIPL